MSNRDIIVIGGSSGAVAPLRDILQRLPLDLPAAIFVVLHMAPQGIGILATVVSAAGQLPVMEAKNGMTIERGKVYLAPPDHHLLVYKDHMGLSRGPRENLSRPAIDPLFRSAAVAYGPRVIGLILSGFLSDGAFGLRAIKRCGGVTLVQDPADAIADEMPRRAMQTTTADVCASSREIGDILSDLVRQESGERPPIPSDIRLEVEIAAGERSGSDILSDLAQPAALTCPSCGGVLSMMKTEGGLRFRCQVGRMPTPRMPLPGNKRIRLTKR